MTTLVVYFQVHQPFRLRPYSFFDIGSNAPYFDDTQNEHILRRVAGCCYLPMNQLLLEAIDRTDGRFRVSFSLSGTVLDQLEAWSPETLASFQTLASTGAVEFLAETSHHSLASLIDEEEFRDQITVHRSRIATLFGAAPTTLRNTELICSRSIAATAEELGFDSILMEGLSRVLGARSPFRPHRVAGCNRLVALARHSTWSDDIAFRFVEPGSPEGPVTAFDLVREMRELGGIEQVAGVFLDYETFGEHLRAETGIFDFMQSLPDAVLGEPGHRFVTPAELFAEGRAAEAVDLGDAFSWADTERDVSAWLGNRLQQEAHEVTYEVGRRLRAAASQAQEGLDGLVQTWRRLTTSDHFYYMSLKGEADGGVHEYFRPYGSPEEAYIHFMNVLDDLARRIEA